MEWKTVLPTSGFVLMLSVACSTANTPAPANTAVPSPTEAKAEGAPALYAVDITPADFVDVVDNPYFPLIPGARYLYENQTEDGLERVEIVVLSETREVMGIAATVVHDTVYLEKADLLSVGESVTVPFGSFDNVVQTRDYTPLEPDLAEHKFYAKGIGVVKTVDLDTGEEEVLVEFTPAGE